MLLTSITVINVQVIAKSTNFDTNKLHEVCWNCFYGSDDSHHRLAVVGQQSAKLLWLLFCKLDSEGKLKLHLQVKILSIFSYIVAIDSFDVKLCILTIHTVYTYV